ncbi:MAG: protoporphyrinogen oxidase [Chlamydiia bacterium]|nr:protoporphyrinogen oxidase [Chlamydiia bacterium]
MNRVIILGGGISGLSTAWYLKKFSQRPLNISVIEKKGRVGGWIETYREEDLLFELGPRGFRPNGKGKETLNLVKDLGLQDELIYANARAKKRYLLHQGKLHSVPNGLFSLLTSSMFRPFIKTLFRERKIPQIPIDDETIADFFRRRFSQEILDLIIDPLVTGIFGGDPEKLSLSSCFPLLRDYELKQGSVMKGLFANNKLNPMTKASLCSFRKGMERLPIALSQKLQGLGVNIYFHSPVESIECKKEKVIVHLHDKSLETDILVSALPPKSLAVCYPSMADQLLEIESVTVAAVSIAYQGQQTEIRGYGFLVPSRENETILGVTFDSDVFPDQGRADLSRYTVMIGGHQVKKSKRAELVECALRQLDRHLGITMKPHATHVAIAREALPQYTLGARKRLESIENNLPPQFFLSGNGFYGLSINDCIFHGKELATKIVRLM